MFLSEIEEQVSNEELISIKSDLDKLNEPKNIICHYLHEKTDYSLYTDTMTLKEFEELPEFEGFC